MKGIKRPLTHSDKRPYELSRAWNYIPELFSLADTDPRVMNLVSRLVSRYLLILTFLIGRAPFFKNCVDYTTFPKACQGDFDHFVHFLFFLPYILHRCYIFSAQHGLNTRLCQAEKFAPDISGRFAGNEFVRIINRKVTS